jgi:hypothetical protein
MDVERGPYCCSLNKRLTFPKRTERSNSATYNRTSHRIARTNFRADQWRFFEAALSLTGDWEDLLPAQINLQPDFERIRRPTPWKNI